MNIKFLLVSFFSVLLVSCVMYEKGYNPTWWDYAVTSENKTNVAISNFRVEKKGYDVLLAMHPNLYIDAHSGDLGTNIPLRGEISAQWTVSGKQYHQTIDLDQFKLRSYKGKSIVFRFNQPNRVDVTLED